MQTDTSLTAIVLCKNAATTLAPCLQSLSFCDAVLVADDHSTDDSVEIARAAHAQITTLDQYRSYAKKRNRAAKSVTKGWILWVDADEVVSRALAQSIRRVLANHQDNNVEGYYLYRRDVFLRKTLRFGEAGKCKLLRLVRAGSGVWKRQVHEIWQSTGRVSVITTGVLRHTPHASIADFLDTINAYTDLEVEERLGSDVVLHPTATAQYWMQLFAYPLAKFLQNYLFRLGCLDGVEGFIHAYIMSLHSLLVRIKLLERSSMK